MNDPVWIDHALAAARPVAISALLRHFRDMDMAEEAFQEASLRALSHWPRRGPPRDPAAWLIMVGRNAAIDHLRRAARQVALPDEAALSDLEDVETPLAEQLDGADYRDDLLRLMFICCHPDLPVTQQIALALRIVCGLSTARIARAFLIGDSAMEQRLTRAKARVAARPVPFDPPGPQERAERLGSVAAMLYLLFNEGYSATGPEAEERRRLCDEAIRLTRLLLRLFPAEPEIMGLLALMLLQHARRDARQDGDGAVILLEDQDRQRWNRALITEGLALVDKAARHRQPGTYQIQAAIAAQHARAARPDQTDWGVIEQLYQLLEQVQPSPVVTLNRAVALAKLEGPEVALALISPLASQLDGYFHYQAVRGAWLAQLGRAGEAQAAFTHAIALAGTAAEAAHIRQYLDRLQSNAG